jgi:hypothetical protein
MHEAPGEMRDPGLGVAIEGAGSAHAEHLLSVASRGPPKGCGQASRLAGLIALLMASTCLDGLRCGLRFVIGQLASDKSAPDGFQFFVVSIEHSVSVRDQVPPKGAHDFDKAPLQPKMALASDHDFGDTRIAQISRFPGLAGTPARLHWRVLCFWGSNSSISAELRLRGVN